MRTETKHRSRRLDASVVLLGATALLAIGPLRGVFEASGLMSGPILFLSTFVLFMVPGALLSHWFTGDRFSGAASVPVAFTLSSGLFGLLAVPMLILNRSLDTYLFFAGLFVGGFLVAAAVRALARAPSDPAADVDPSGSGLGWLWLPFVGLGAILAFSSWSKIPAMYDDIWIYLSNIREFVNTEHLALYEPYFGRETGISRVRINGWLVEQAAMSRVSGIDPIELVLRYLAPTLVFVALLAYYALAITLFKKPTAALLTASLCALFFAVNLSDSLLTFGGEFVGRITEDKFAARFIFLPVTLSLAVAFLESGRLRYLWFFGFICWSLMAVHPVGLALAGLSMAGFGLVYLLINRRRREAWTKMVSLGAVLLSAIVVPAVVVFVLTGESLTAALKEADINSNDPDVLANMVFVRPERERIFELGPDLYIMHPSLLLDPVILGAFLLGLPFLVRRLKRSLGAQLLTGMLLLTTAVCYVPWLATFMGDYVVVPGQLWRLAWPIPLAALLTASWMTWETLRRGESCLTRLAIPPAVGRFLPLVLLGALTCVALPASVAGAAHVERSEDFAQSPRSCFDPIFRWMQTNIDEPSVVLAPDGENTCIPAYSASANVLSLRGALVLNTLPALEQRAPGKIEVPQGALDVRTFYSDPASEESAWILRRYDVDYVLVRAGSATEQRLRMLPGFAAVDAPGERYALFAVDAGSLDPQALFPPANDHGKRSPSPLAAVHGSNSR